MNKLRKAEDRGKAQIDWLKSYHSFSFADYYDPKHMHFRNLRVINEDFIKGGGGFATHPHKDMEIITYVIQGALEHKDSMGNGSVIQAGDFQKMSAGSGITHSEFNHSKDEEVHLYQIWVLPREKGIKPEYQQFSKNEFVEGENGLKLIADSSGEGTIKFYQDVKIYQGAWEGERSIRYSLAPGRGVWIQVVCGDLNVQGEELHEGDGFAIEGSDEISILSKGSAEFLLFDLG